MPTSEEAEELYDQLIAVLEDDQWQNRFSQVVGEVREAVARGDPARGEISDAGKRKREVVADDDAHQAGVEILLEGLVGSCDLVGVFSYNRPGISPP